MKRLFLLLPLLFIPFSVKAQIFVDAGSAYDQTQSDVGTAWNKAYDSLSVAITNATAGDSIFVKGSGIFKPLPNGLSVSDRSTSFTINKAIGVFGGFLGTETGSEKEILAARPANFVQDTLSGDIGILGNSSDNCYQVVVVSSTGAVLDGFAITGGKGTNRGGGVYMTGAGILRHLEVYGNESKFGGGVYISNGGISHSIIRNNNATSNSGGILIEGNSVIRRVTNCVIHSNTARFGGGGIKIGSNSSSGSTSAIELLSNTIYNNSCSWSDALGGALLIEGQNLGVVTANSLIYGNRVPSAANGHEVTNYTAGATFAYNLVKGASVGEAIRQTAFTSTRGCIFTTTSPFASTTAGDANFLHLSTASEGIQVGDNDRVTWALDLAGLARIAQGTVDIGAYEGTYTPKTIYVDAGNSAATTKDGTTWENAYDSLNLALDAATSSDTILVKAGGTFKPTPYGHRDRSFIIDKAIAVYGGFAGTETGTSAKAILAQRPTTYTKPILSGDIGTANDENDNSYHVVVVSAARAVLDGFAITRGKAQGASANNYDKGGGVYMTANSTLHNLELYTNSASHGAGVYMTDGTITHSVVRANNNDTGAGGGISASGGRIINNLIYSNNSGASSVGGGIVLAQNATVQVLSNTIYDNSSPNWRGGGVYIRPGNVSSVITNNLIYGNRAGNAGKSVYNEDSANTTFTYNLVEGANVGEAISGTALSSTTGCVFTTTSPFASTTEADANFLHLTGISRAIQSGDNSRVTWAKDLAGSARIAESVVDVGAYEGLYTGTSFYVDADNTSSPQVGTNWATAYDELSEAIEAIEAGDTIFVKGGGTLKPTDGTDRTLSFTIDKAIAIYGGFLGTEIGLSSADILAQRPANFVQAILSGDIGTIGTDTDNSNTVVTISAAGVLLDGFAITGGHGGANGAGVNISANATLRNLEIHNNKATSKGSGVYMTAGTVTHSTIRNNSKAGGGLTGGGVYMTGGTLTHSKIYNNTDGEGSGGGGIYASGGDILNNLIYSNTAVAGGSGGGGMRINNGTVDVISNTIYGNTNRGIFASTATVNLYNNVIYNNTVDEIFISSAATATFQYNLIKGASLAEAIGGTAPTDLTGNIATNTSPFASTTEADANFLQLTTTTEALQAGDNSRVTWDKDFAALPRIRQYVVDIGAYEGTYLGVAYYVDAGNGNATTKDGTTWANAFDSLHLAIAAARSYDTLFVKAGGSFRLQNTESVIKDRTKSFTLKVGMHIYGGFLGIETGTTAKAILAQRPATYIRPILSGEIGQNENDSVYHVVSIPGTQAVLDGFVITGGKANVSSGNRDKGGGIYMTGNSILRNLDVHHNIGGGLYITTGTITHSLIHHNESAYGGGVLTGEGAKIFNCAIYNNTTTVSGAGVYMSGASIVLVNSTLYNNTASIEGGGLYINSSNAELYNNLIYGNTASTEIKGYEVFNQSAGASFENNLVKGANEAAAIRGTAFTSTPNCIFTTTSPYASTTEADANFLHLNTTTIALQTGNNNRITWALDLSGKPRIVQHLVDIGAYEGIYVGKAYYVDADNEDAATKDGSSWANAFDDLRLAIAAVRVFDTLLAKGGGTFVLQPATNANKDRTLSFTLKHGMVIYGGFAGTETGATAKAVLAQRPANFVKSTLSGVIGTGADDKVYHVVTVSGEEAVLDGFVITGGKASGASADNYDKGAGIYMTADATLRNLEIHNNSEGQGAGVYMTKGTLTYSIVRNNSTSVGAGGGISAGGGRIINNLIHNNTCSSVGVAGGILLSSNATVELLSNTIYGNSSPGWRGGGVYINPGNSGSTLANNLIYGNTAGDLGNNVFNQNNEAVTFTYNLVEGADVGAAISGTTPTDLTGCVFTEANPFASTTSSDALFLRLHPGSLAVDAGDNDHLPLGETLDLAGLPRISRRRIDIGAYEATLATWYVIQGGAGTMDGTSWANAYDLLPLALAAAHPFDTIFVKGGGVFKPTDGTDRDVSFTLGNKVAVYGGLLGTETGTAKEILAARPANFVKPTLSGDIGTAITTLGDFTDVGYADNSKGVVKVTADGAVLDGFAIVAADNTGGNGGGVFMTGNSTLRNLEIYGNISNDGAAVHLTHGTITHSILRNNWAKIAGGGVVVKERGRVINNVIRGNTADSDWPSGGGGGLFVPGINHSTYRIEILSNTIYNNTATGGHGGGITFDHYHSNSIVVSNNIFYDNKAPAEGKKDEINAFGAGGSVTFSHNLVKGANASTAIQGTFNSGTPNCIFTTTNPFASTAAGDENFLRLNGISSALQAGDNSQVDWTYDLAGSARIAEHRVDMGAYEGLYSGTARYVDAGNSAAITKDGSNWANAYDSLSTALADVAAGDTIFVKGGSTFALQPSTVTIKDRTLSFTLKPNMAVYGGFLGTETGITSAAILAQRPPNFTHPVLSAKIGDSADDSVYHVVTIPENADGAVLDGFSITGGKANGASANNYDKGAGVYMLADATLRHLEVHNNSASKAAGIYMATGQISHSVIRDNANSGSAGAGIFAGNGSLIFNNLIYGNSITGSSAGAGIFIDTNVTVQVLGNTIYNNSAPSWQGGGIYISAGAHHSVIANNILYDNSAQEGNDVYNGATEHVGFEFNLVKGANASVVGGAGFFDVSNCIFTDVSPFLSTTETDATFLRLRPGSSAVDAGNNELFPPGEASDFGGLARITRDRIDMGANEATHTTLYVAAGGAGTRDGSSWANAYDLLSSALSTAQPYDTVFVKGGGLFKPTTGTERAKSFTLKGNVAVYGGFLGTETGATAKAILAQRPANFVKDTLSGDIGTIGTDTDNSYHVVHITAAGAVLDGFVISGGKADGASADNYDKGAGVYMTTNSTLRNLEIYDNAASRGAGVYMTDGAITHSIVRDNTNSDDAGGGIYAAGSSLILNNLIHSNTCGSSSVGGGILVASNATAQLLSNTIYGNNAPNWRGGGVYIQPSNSGSVLSNNLIYGNTSGDSGDNVHNQGNSGITFTYNLVEGANVGAAVDGTAPTDLTGCIFTETDPFVSTTVGDANFLHLSAVSDALHVGDNSRITWSEDLAGIARIRGPFVDIGVYEQARLPRALFVVEGGAGTKDGSSWANAYDSLNLALAAAEYYDTIFVKGGGTFKPTAGTSRDKSFLIGKYVYVYGGFLGTETGTAAEILAARPTNFTKPILSGDIGTAISTIGDFDDAGYADNSKGVVKVTGDGAVLDGFAIVAANNTGNGGGVNMAGNSILRNLAIFGNIANDGGGVRLKHGTLTHSSIYNNKANAAGGAVALKERGRVINNLIYGNTADASWDSGGGGAFYISGVNEPTYKIEILNNTVYNNTASGGHGGGITFDHYHTNTIVVANNIFYDNNAPAAQKKDEINVFGGGNSVTFSYNLVKGANSSATIQGTFSSGTPNCIFTTTSPFASTTEADANFLHLTATAEALQAGDNSQVDWHLDFSGSTRIGHEVVDIGAHEGFYTGTIYYVDAGNSAANTKDGTSWTNAYDSLHLAIANAYPGDTLLVKGGAAFKLQNTAATIKDRTLSFTLKQGMVIYGGFAGTETGTTAKAIFAQRPANFVKDTLSGLIGTEADDKVYHVVTIPEGADGAVLDGFMISDGKADGASSDNYDKGAGVYMAANATLRNLEIYDNSEGQGAGVYMTDGTLTHSIVRDNDATSNAGGGISASGGRVINNLIHGNSCTSSSIGGGVLLDQGGVIELLSNTIYGNSAPGWRGGGLYIRPDNSNSVVVNNLIYGNTAVDAGNNVYNENNTAIIFTHNLVQGASLGEAIRGTAPNSTTGCIFTTENPFLNTDSKSDYFLRLFLASEAVDAGTNAHLPTTLTTDLAGNQRIFNTTVDIGAYEPASTIHYVDAGSTASTKDGTSWSSAYKSLSLAMEVATDLDYVFVKGGGTFKPTSGTDRDKSFTVDKPLLVYGGFAGTETGTADEILAARPVNFVKPTLSGDIGTAISTIGDFTDTGYDDNSKGVVKVTTDGAVLDGFAIVAANNTGNGGGVNMTGNSILRNLEVYGNIANDGGGIDLTHGTITHSVLYGNKARSAGGGVAIKERGRIINNVIHGNTADADWASGGGGGLYVPGVNQPTYKIEILSNTIYNNTATGGHGGGITFDHYHSNVIVASNNIFYDNKAPTEGKKDEINVFGAGSSVTFSYNLVKGADASANIWGAFGGGMPNCIFTTTSPFASTTEADANFLHLKTNAFAIQAGGNSYATWAKDMGGNARIQGNYVDIGAYESTRMQSIRYVDAGNGGAATKDGTSWANAYDSLHLALNDAAAYDTLLVKGGGIFKPTNKADRTKSFTIDKAIAAYGGFLGTETGATAKAILAQRPANFVKDTLSGIIGSGADDKVYHVVTVTSAGAILDGFAITGGKATGASSSNYDKGAGIYMTGNSTLRNLDVHNNTTSTSTNNARGGGVYIGAGTITHSLIRSNTSVSGGGIYVLGDAKVLNCAIYGNATTSLSGGGVNIAANSTSLLVNNTIHNNTTFLFGGGLAVNGAGSKLYNNLIYGNTASTATNGHEVYSAAAGATFAYNLVKGADAAEAIKGAAFTSTPSCVFTTSNPYASMTEGATNFLHLSESSHAFQKGDHSQVTWVQDLAGSDRIRELFVDIGAFEGSYTAKMRYVDAGNESAATKDGTSWANAYDNLHLALVLSNSFDTLFVKGGGAFELQNPEAAIKDRTLSFTLKRNMAVYGGFLGTETGTTAKAILAQRPTNFVKDTLSGIIGTETDDKVYHVVTIPEGADGAVLDGFVISGGKANGASPDNYDKGGGVYMAANATLRALEIHNNSEGHGAGVYMTDGTLTHSIVRDNDATSNSGGGVSAGGGRIINNLIYNNTCSPTGIAGGVLLSQGAAVQLLSNTIYGNSAPGWRGGGLYIRPFNSNSVIANNLIYGNTAVDTGNNVYNENNTAIAFTHNLIQGAHSGTAIHGTVPSDLTGCIFTTEDQFVSTTIGDSDFLHLHAASLALQAGNNSHVSWSKDLAGNSRPQGDVVDIGAYEGDKAGGEVFYVIEGGAGTKDGSNWANAYDSLHLALEKARASDYIFVRGGGAFKPTAGTLRTSTFAIHHGYSVYGGFLGTEVGTPSEIIAARPTNFVKDTLSGDIGVVETTTDNSYHVVTITSGAAGFILDGFVIESGNADGSLSQGRGGGVYMEGRATLQHVEIRANHAFSLGGGVYMTDGNLSRSLVRDNTSRYGAGAYLVGGTVVHSVLRDNVSTRKGGGVYLVEGDVLNNLIHDNRATGSDRNGGGILAKKRFQVINNTIYNNTAGGFGGGVDILAEDASSVFANNIIYDNVANTNARGFEVYNRQTGAVFANNLVRGSGAGSAIRGTPFVETPGCVFTLTSPFYTTDLSSSDYLRLGSGSEAVDAGDNTHVLATLTTDLRGNARIKGDVVDIGAYEGAAIDITDILLTLVSASVPHLTAANVKIGDLSATTEGLGISPAITYSLKNGDTSADTFKIEGSELKTNKAIDYDKLNGFHSPITIVASHTPQSGSTVNYEKVFTIEITSPTLTGIVLDGNASSPGGTAGDRIGTLTATGTHLPTDGHTGITFTLESENGNTTATYFQVGSGNELQVKTALVEGTYNLVFKASYIGVEYTHTAIEVSVTSAASITDILLSSSAVGHLTAANVKVADLSASHANLGDNPTITYSLKNANAATDTFKVIGSELKTNKAIDYDKLNGSHSPITIVASHTPQNGGAVTYEELVTIAITPPAITGIALSNALVKANAVVDTEVGTLTATGTHLPSDGSGIAYTIAEGNGAGYFKIADGSSLKVASALQAGTYNLKFTATYLGISYTNATPIAVVVSSVGITDISLSPASVEHLTAANVKVGDLSATTEGLGANPTITYSLKNANAATDTFKVVASELRVNKVIDYDKLNDSHSPITIVASHTPQSGNTVSYEKSFTVTITPPTVTGVSPTTLDILADAGADVTVGELTATGTHLPSDGSGVTFSITGGNDDGVFKIDGNTLKTAKEVPSNPSSYTLQVKASYLGITQATATPITIHVGTFSITNVTFADNLSEKRILSGTSEDADVGVLKAAGTGLPTGDSGIQYSITGGNEAGVFRVDGNVLKTAKSVPNEPNSYTLQVSARYAGVEGSGDIRIRILNPAITAIATNPASLSVAHGTAANTNVATLSASHTDLEGNPTIVFNIKDFNASSSPFKVEGTQLKTNLLINKTQLGASSKLTLIASHTPSGGATLTKEQEITIAITGSVTSPLGALEALEVYVYPNPTTGLLHLRSAAKVKRLRLLDASGAVVLSSKWVDVLDIGGLPSGTYLLEFVTASVAIRVPVLRR